MKAWGLWDKEGIKDLQEIRVVDSVDQGDPPHTPWLSSLVATRTPLDKRAKEVVCLGSC